MADYKTGVSRLAAEMRERHRQVIAAVVVTMIGIGIVVVTTMILLALADNSAGVEGQAAAAVDPRSVMPVGESSPMKLPLLALNFLLCYLGVYKIVSREPTSSALSETLTDVLAVARILALWLILWYLPGLLFG